jgi:hypothetical protein
MGALPLADHHPTERNPTSLRNRLSQHRVDVLAGFPVRRQIVARIVIDRID